MSKAVEGAVLLAGAATLGAFTMGIGGVALEGLTQGQWAINAIVGLAAGGISMEAGAIAGALANNSGLPITTRQAAANRQIIYGEQRVGGIIIYKSTTGGSHDQLNYVIAIAAHQVESIVNLYLDGRQVHWQAGSAGNSTRNGVNFGGNADGGTYVGPDGINYNFGGTGHSGIYCEARYGDQAPGDVITGLTANDPVWAASADGSPWVGGCCYVYLKIEANPSLFPGEPEIRFTVRGKNNIWDPRSQTSGYTNNWALCVADVITDPVYGLGDNSVNQLQLIAAANVCDEIVPLAVSPGNLTEARYTTNYHYDTSVAPGSVLDTMLLGAAGRLSWIGGQWFIWPAYWQGPSFTYDESILTSQVQWKPYRSTRDLINRVNGTYIAPTYPYNVAGNLYDQNGWYNGQIQNNFPYAWQPTNAPQYASDHLHGYPSDEWLLADQNIQRPMELALATCISVTQWQRVAKINLLRNRQQGSGTLEMGLAAYSMQPTDVFQLNYTPGHWTNKILEVTGTSFKVAADQDGGAPSIRVSYNVIETDSSVYEWNPTAEELTPMDAPASPSQTPLIPAVPTNFRLVSGPGTAILGDDGSVIPVIEIQFDTPLDNQAVQIQVQYQLVGAASWLSAPAIDISLNIGLISGVVGGQVYNVRIRSTRANGVSSDWVQISNYTVVPTGSFLGTLSGLVPQIYTGLSNNLVPNGDFITGDGKGWSTASAEYRVENGGMLIGIAGPGGHAFSPAFAVQPGNKYRIQFVGGVAVDGSRVFYQRIFYGSQYSAASINDGGVPGYMGLFDFLPGGDMNNAWVTYTYDWVCPPGAYYASLAMYSIGTAMPVFGRVVAQDYSASGEWGADVTTSQPISYSGSSESIVPNGGFVLGTLQGWANAGFSYSVDGFGPRIYASGSSGASCFSPSFAVVPGQKYRLNYDVYNGSGAGGIYLRMAWNSSRLDNISDFGTGNVQDFVASGSIPNTPTVYSFDWTCPAGQFYASMNIYAVGASDLACKYVSCIPYAASGQWGSDVTGANTSHDTSNVSGVPASTIAQVVPTGYKLYINNGARSYSLQAV
ncbi:hypothetical protein [Granulicella sp. dw_53]|uniref:hypothetical protein n=1 Tax=Granulicella sp. dw_53 TaxID=2719792 RepID=UPI001BD542E4|nr:hypothetical protein [Granulicella sp. dw_53]